MYRIIKDEGTSANIFLQNTDTMAELNLGRITPELLRLLTSEEDYIFGDDYGDIKLSSKWSLTVGNDTKDKLRKLAMPMSKPVRKTKVNNNVVENTKEKDNEEEEDDLDLFDLIYSN